MTDNESNDILDLPFYEYARLITKRRAEDSGVVGVNWLSFDELVASEMTEVEIETQYGEEIAINVGIARDPEDPYWWTDWSKARPAIEGDPKLVEAYRRGELKGPAKEIIELGIDHDVLDHLRKGGGDWKTWLNATLRKAVFG
jgi:uncharacterized protein (DUF4415 family)